MLLLKKLVILVLQALILILLVAIGLSTLRHNILLVSFVIHRRPLHLMNAKSDKEASCRRLDLDYPFQESKLPLLWQLVSLIEPLMRGKSVLSTLVKPPSEGGVVPYLEG